MFVFISINCVIECVHYKLNYVVESHMVRDKNYFKKNYNGLFHESVKTGKDKKYRTDTSCLVYYLALTGVNLFSGGPKPLWFWCYSPSGPSVS